MKGRSQAINHQRMDWVRTLASKGAQALAAEHFRYRRHAAGSAVVHLVLIDMSASMLRTGKLARAKGCLLALMQQAYRDREHIGVISFGGQGAYWLARPGKARAFNESWIAPLGASGGTPLESGLQLLSSAIQKTDRLTHVWLLTDGRFARLPEKPQGMDHCTIVDLELDELRLQRCQALAEHWQAQRISLGEGTNA